MKSVLLILLIVVFAIMLITYPIKIKAAFHINALEDVGFCAVKFTNLKLFCGRFKLTKNGKIEVNNAVKKKKKKKNKVVKQNYLKCLAKLVRVIKFELFFDGGLANNAYLLSMLCGYISAFNSAISAVLMSHYSGVRVFTRINPVFDEDCLQFSGSVVLRVTILDVLLSFICAYMCYIKMKIKEKKNA